jgi:hypothetical protein
MNRVDRITMPFLSANLFAGSPLCMNLDRIVSGKVKYAEKHFRFFKKNLLCKEMHKYNSIYQQGYTYGHDILNKCIIMGKLSWKD